MIQGLQLEVKAEELGERIGARIAHHKAQVKACEARLKELRTVRESLKEDRDTVLAIKGADIPGEAIARKLRKHEERAASLAFLRDHLVRGEVYRLNDHDLRLADLVPESVGRW